ncbi:MAG: hypothetical protein SynsKO_18290 [Synoicihabitans sp.]
MKHIFESEGVPKMIRVKRGRLFWLSINGVGGRGSIEPLVGYYVDRAGRGYVAGIPKDAVLDVTGTLIGLGVSCVFPSVPSVAVLALNTARPSISAISSRAKAGGLLW